MNTTLGFGNNRPSETLQEMPILHILHSVSDTLLLRDPNYINW